MAEGMVPTAPPPTVAPPKCPEGWTRVGTRAMCAKVQPSVSLEWTQRNFVYCGVFSTGTLQQCDVSQNML